MNTYLSTITLSANGLSAPIKRRMEAAWITKQDLFMCCLQEIHFRLKDTHSLKVNGLKKIFHENGNKLTTAWVTILILDKIDLNNKINNQNRNTLIDTENILMAAG